MPAETTGQRIVREFLHGHCEHYEWLATRIDAAIAEAQRDTEQLFWHVSLIAAACVDEDLSEAYHQCYLAIVKDLTLPAEEQRRLMESAIDAARAKAEVECP